MKNYIPILTLVAITLTLAWAFLVLPGLLSSTEPAAPAHSGTPVLSYFDPAPDGPAMIYMPSTLDIQRELNRRHPKLNLTIDGVCGPKTQTAWDAECNTQSALLLWPEDAK